jgi:hypothetical protein
MDGDKQAAVEPKRGVRQGYPIIPALFAWYISDLSQELKGPDHAWDATTRFGQDVVVRDLSWLMIWS